jgi:hypothetical protein
VAAAAAASWRADSQQTRGGSFSMRALDWSPQCYSFFQDMDGRSVGLWVGHRPLAAAAADIPTGKRGH